jgi:hypothetical protein
VRADTNAKGLKDAVQKADKESTRLAAEAARAQELVDHAEALVAARELLVKAADAGRTVAEAETQLGVARARKAPDADLQRLQAAVDKAKAAAPPQAEVDKAVQAATAAEKPLQDEREQAKLKQQIADLEAQKAKAELAANEAEATAQKARSSGNEATGAVSGLAQKLDDAKGRLKVLEMPPAPAGGTDGPAGGTGGSAGGPTTSAPMAPPV